MSVKFAWYGHKAIRAGNAVAVNAVFETLEVCLQEANRLCPLEEGTLRGSGAVVVGSGQVTTAKSAAGDASVSVASKPGAGDTPRGFISYDTPYATRLHENPGYTFQQGRVGKWLETTMKEKCMSIFERVCAKHKIK
jgi:hypothetical protein